MATRPLAQSSETIEPATLTHLQRLEAEIQSGDWDAKYGELRTRESYDVGFQFVVAEAQSGL